MPPPDAPLAWKALEWDSEHFGFGVASADLTGATPATLRALDDQLREAGITCAYGSHDPAEPTLSATIQGTGWTLMDSMSRFQIRPGDRFTPEPSTCDVRIGTVDDLAAMREVVESLAPWSRFAVDPRFGLEVATELHVLGVERAAAEGRLLVAEHDGAIEAFVTRHRAPEPTMHTIATLGSSSGAADAVVAASREWAGDQPLSLAWAAARNIACFRLFARLGFRVAEVRYQYHRWLDDT